MLLVWLPLNNSTKNQGVCGIETTGSPSSWENGKLGTCAKFNGDATKALLFNSTTQFKYTDNFSWSVWVKPNYTDSDPLWVFTVGRADTGGRGYGLRIFNSSTVYIYYGTHVLVIPLDNTWHHIAFTKKGNTLSFYKDGEIITTVNYTGAAPTFAESKGLGIGGFYYTVMPNPIYPCYSYINDFRLYDHCLSPKEIKLIQRGLVLHFPLNLPEHSTNYVTGNYSIRKTSTGETTSGTLTCTMTPEILKANVGKKLWLSYDVKADGDRTGTVGSTDRRFGIHGHCKIDGSDKYPFTNYLTYYGPMTRVTMVWTIPSGNITSFNVYLNASGNSYSRPTDSETEWFIGNIKLEIGDSATPFTPYNDSIEYDVSGFNNNGTTSAISPTWSSDSPRYNGCYQFGPNSYIESTVNLGNKYSVSFWCKLTDTSTSTTKWIFCINSGENAGKIGLYLQGKTSAVLYYENRIASSIVVPDMSQWRHVVITNDGTICTLYVDGVKLTHTYNVSTSTTHNRLQISGRNGSTSYRFPGLISDFRIYAEALSEDEIEKLYKVSAMITKN